MRRLLNILLLTLAAVLPAGAQINTDQVLRIGQNTLYFEDYILSIQYFNQVIKAKPYLAEPYFFRAVAKINLDDFAGAEQDASLCLERNPFMIDAYQVRGVARQNQQKFAEAIADYEHGLSLNPENRIFLLNKGVCHLELEQWGKADTTLHQLLRYDAKNERGHLALAQMHLQMADTTQALAALDSSLAINRNSTMAYGMRASVYWNRQQFEQARSDLDSVIRLEPRNAGTLINRAYLNYKLDDYVGALADYDNAIALEPTNVMAIYDRAQLSAEVGEDYRAIADFSQVLALEPTNFLALYNRAQLYMRTRQFRNAVADYDEILKKYPRFESGYMSRAEAKRLMGDQRGSDRDNERAIAIFKSKGVKVSTFNPAELEARRAEKKFKEEQEAGKMRQPETEQEIIEKFDAILTVAPDNNIKPEYANRSRGHIQNSNTEVDPEPMFHLTYYSPLNKLNGKTAYMREVTEANETHLLPMTLGLSSARVVLSQDYTNERFASIDYYNGLMATSQPRAIDYLARAIDYMMVRDPEHALADAHKATQMNPDFVLAHLLMADAHYMQWENSTSTVNPLAVNKTVSNDEASAGAMMRNRDRMALLDSVAACLQQVLELSPRSPYAIYNMAGTRLLQGRLNEALQGYSQALALKPDLGEAYYNRGLVHLRLGQKAEGVADLSKAGELGILPSYNVIKRMNR